MELRFFIIRRLLLLIPTLIGLTLLTFILVRALPTSLLLSQYVNPHSTLPRSVQIAHAKAILGLDYPVPIQYFFYLAALIHGNWGFMVSNFYTGPVLTGIEEFFPNTLQLTIFAVILSVLISIPLGTYIGSKPNSLADHAGRIFSLAVYAMPAFVLALLFQIVFGRGAITGNPLGVFPISGTFNYALVPFPVPSWLTTPGTSALVSHPTHLIIFDALIHHNYAIAYSGLLHIVLPVLTLTLGILAGIVRFLRAGMMDNMRQEYVKTARAKGVPEKVIIRRHIRKNALIPTVTVLGLLFASLLGGVVLIEDVFDYPGMGLLGINAITSYSIYGVMGVTLVFGLVLVFANLIVDVVYAFLDPRIRY
ncbi:ABC transport system permease protein P1P2A1A2 [Thermoplasma volcanium GSS1]|uniref:ABC transport system permease protein P1P2A1A2 n=1 Tax=Thermoplasma volcanium (strain ATCC 51530 / DSM 4299 / JCM 9571 / NBRC 15438 / GSS1) TaxID=273116 RepID=Q978R0_THEVO|nr:ABC transporter permease [Thermoplasma volcanium]BAB60497.1 ABC transport system permease protein P1P2A1A2 [Thermoplasma volcanium GSS1]